MDANDFSDITANPPEGFPLKQNNPNFKLCLQWFQLCTATKYYLKPKYYVLKIEEEKY
jgi:hypothetical protein